MKIQKIIIIVKKQKTPVIHDKTTAAGTTLRPLDKSGRPALASTSS